MRSPQSRGTIKEIIMFDTHEFVSTLKTVGASEEQATIVLRAVSKALETTTEGFVKMDALTDLKLAMIEMRADITSQLSVMRADVNSQLSEMKTNVNSQLSELRADVNSQLSEMRAETSKRFTDVDMKIADLKSETAEIKSVKLIAVTTLTLTVSILMAAIAAVVKQLL
jgi:metal-dependent amidase/aminoacylase/carboxypeptidase family protein